MSMYMSLSVHRLSCRGRMDAARITEGGWLCMKFSGLTIGAAVAIGIAVGAALGVAFDNLAVGMAFGVGGGILIGAISRSARQNRPPR